VSDAVVAEGVTGELATPGVAEEFVDKLERLSQREVWEARSAATLAQADEVSQAAMGCRYLALINERLAGQHDLPRPRRVACPPAAWNTVLAAALRSRLTFFGRRLLRPGQILANWGGPRLARGRSAP
jgi:hypothetical protein